MDTITRVRELRQKAAEELTALYREISDLQGRYERKKAEVSEYDSALKVLRSLDSMPGSDHPISGGSGQVPPIYGDKGITAKKAIEEVLKTGSASDGFKVGELRELAYQRYATEITGKTTSNILWKLKEEGKARNENRRWFPKEIEAPADTEASEGGGAGVD